MDIHENELVQRLRIGHSSCGTVLRTGLSAQIALSQLIVVIYLSVLSSVNDLLNTAGITSASKTSGPRQGYRESSCHARESEQRIKVDLENAISFRENNDPSYVHEPEVTSRHL
jgi:hypothetical protein